jgi:hypothetical protein
LESLEPDVLELIRDRVVDGPADQRVKDKDVAENAKLRKNALNWLERLRKSKSTGEEIEWSQRPTEIDSQHWANLHLGALFFQTRETALELLDQFEELVGNTTKQEFRLTDNVPNHLVRKCDELRKLSSKIRRLQGDQADKTDAAGDKATSLQLAVNFCQECESQDNASLLRNLVSRDGRGLCLRGDKIVPGPAFQGLRSHDLSVDETEMVDHPKLKRMTWPPGLSRRIRALYSFNFDLRNIKKLDGKRARDRTS